MKAKLKTTGEIIEVEDFGNGAYGRIDGPVVIYKKSLLDFNISAPEKAVIEGWIAIDEAFSGQAYLHIEKPHDESVEFCDTGEYEIEWKSNGKCYLLDRNLFPDMTPEDAPKRVKIEITLIDE